MQDIISRLKTLHRPRLLVRTARIGACSYSRERDLRRVLGYGPPPRAAAAVMQLLEAEQEVNQQRLRGDATYAITRHVDILIAMVGEAEYLASADRQVPGVVIDTDQTRAVQT